MSRSLNSFFFLQAGDTVGNLLPFGVRLLSPLMSVVYVLIVPESDCHAGIQYDRFPLHACDHGVRVRRDSQLLQLGGLEVGLLVFTRF